ncbi:ABC transporter ATP-binding protein [Cutibacterium modestum]|uniref:ABC transporter ATP-binding protein n=1 Tax=Cutibacterium modestum TaxID=2559073 RepID=UPI0020A2D576|nr:ABC transporter ATP-binding protein [Cutibacterium modestum]MCP2379355.1 ABC transporter ATP-binding protein [Cutibacterium modestum 31N]
MTRLDVRNVQCRIGDRVIVDDVSFTAEAGQLSAIVGVNGVGKSTLLRSIAGVRKVNAGDVLLDGKSVNQYTPMQRARLMAFVGQEESPSPDLLLGEMVALGRTPHRKPWQVGQRSERAIIRDALALVGLDHLIDRRCDHLSGGERRRAVIARGLAQGADLILLDEPTNHLDVRHQLQLLETLRASGRTVVATIHVSMAASHFDRVVVLASGGVLATGPAEEALSSSNVATAFHVVAHHVTTPEGSRELVCTAALPEPSRKEI